MVVAEISHISAVYCHFSARLSDGTNHPSIQAVVVQCEFSDWSMLVEVLFLWLRFPWCMQRYLAEDKTESSLKIIRRINWLTHLCAAIVWTVLTPSVLCVADRSCCNSVAWLDTPFIIRKSTTRKRYVMQVEVVYKAFRPVGWPYKKRITICDDTRRGI